MIGRLAALEHAVDPATHAFELRVEQLAMRELEQQQMCIARRRDHDADGRFDLGDAGDGCGSGSYSGCDLTCRSLRSLALPALA